MIRAVLFDLDETLFDRHISLGAFLADQYLRFAGCLGDVSLDTWRQRFLERDARGRVHKSIVYEALLCEFGGDPDAAETLLRDYQLGCSRHARPVPGATETLRTLRGFGLRLAIVTNGETAFQGRHVDVLGLVDQVDAVLISEAEGLRKPDTALFLRAAGRLGIDPSQCLFVGDDPSADILGGHAAGMRTAWLAREGEWPDRLGPMPGIAIRSLHEVIAFVSAAVT